MICWPSLFFHYPFLFLLFKIWLVSKDFMSFHFLMIPFSYVFSPNTCQIFLQYAEVLLRQRIRFQSTHRSHSKWSFLRKIALPHLFSDWRSKPTPRILSVPDSSKCCADCEWSTLSVDLTWCKVYRRCKTSTLHHHIPSSRTDRNFFQRTAQSKRFWWLGQRCTLKGTCTWNPQTWRLFCECDRLTRCRRSVSPRLQCKPRHRHPVPVKWPKTCTKCKVCCWVCHRVQTMVKVG